MNNCSVVDMFCGIGGLTHGFVKEGFNVVAGFDADEKCKLAFEQNNDAIFYAKNIEHLSADDLRILYPPGDIRILIGCAPCQPFSSYAAKSTNDKWKLLYNFSSLILESYPDIVSMENVIGLRKYAEGAIYKDFTNRLEDRGYYISSYDVFCPDYGIPQHRTRLVMFASRFGEIKLIPKTHTSDNYKTVHDTISFLEPIEHGQSSKSDPLHKASRLSEKNLLRIKASVPGGTWRDWDEDLVASCHKKESGKTYSSVYGRMKWNAPSPTITTQCYGFGNGRFGHPEQDRAISLREAALIQTFPKGYKFLAPASPVCTKDLGTQIGNAVPVKLGQVIAKSICEHLKIIRGC